MKESGFSPGLDIERGFRLGLRSRESLLWLAYNLASFHKLRVRVGFRPRIKSDFPGAAVLTRVTPELPALLLLPLCFTDLLASCWLHSSSEHDTCLDTFPPDHMICESLTIDPANS